MVKEDGTILNYGYINGRRNVDMINAGKILFDVYEQTGNPKYKKAMDLLYNAMVDHPRNSLGGFWHKEVYPWQMWLDGLYMASPYLAQYAQVNNKPELLNDVIMQFLIVEKFMRDPVTGLYFHAWDEKKVQKWCDPVTGLSHHFWGRSIGWWYMALVDVLDFVPENHPLRDKLLVIADELARTLPEFQHDGLWYQIVNLEEREGNYQEATASAMFMYAVAKAVNKGYIEDITKLQLRLKGTAHNLAIKGFFKYIDPNGAEAAALIAEGYEKVNWGVDLVKYKDHYTDTHLLPGVKAGNVAPRFYWPMPFETLTMSKGKITNGYGLAQE